MNKSREVRAVVYLLVFLHSFYLSTCSCIPCSICTFSHADIFFQEERSRLLREIENGNDVLEAEGKSQGLFALMGKSIAKKWKSLTQDEMVKYTDSAKEDLKRYRSEMDEYQYVLEFTMAWAAGPIVDPNKGCSSDRSC
jgi:hypothetical protein